MKSLSISQLPPDNHVWGVAPLVGYDEKTKEIKTGEPIALFLTEAEANSASTDICQKYPQGVCVVRYANGKDASAIFPPPKFRQTAHRNGATTNMTQQQTAAAPALSFYYPDGAIVIALSVYNQKTWENRKTCRQSPSYMLTHPTAFLFVPDNSIERNSGIPKNTFIFDKEEAARAACAAFWQSDTYAEGNWNAPKTGGKWRCSFFAHNEVN